MRPMNMSASISSRPVSPFSTAWRKSSASSCHGHEAPVVVPGQAGSQTKEACYCKRGSGFRRMAKITAEGIGAVSSVGEGCGVEAVTAVAELACHPYLAVDHHVGQILDREALEQILDAGARAAAIGV